MCLVFAGYSIILNARWILLRHVLRGQSSLVLGFHHVISFASTTIPNLEETGLRKAVRNVKRLVIICIHTRQFSFISLAYLIDFPSRTPTSLHAKTC